MHVRHHRVAAARAAKHADDCHVALAARGKLGQRIRRVVVHLELLENERVVAVERWQRGTPPLVTELFEILIGDLVEDIVVELHLGDTFVARVLLEIILVHVVKATL